MVTLSEPKIFFKFERERVGKFGIKRLTRYDCNSVSKRGEERMGRVGDLTGAELEVWGKGS